MSYYDYYEDDEYGDWSSSSRRSSSGRSRGANDGYSNRDYPSYLRRGLGGPRSNSEPECCYSDDFEGSRRRPYSTHDVYKLDETWGRDGGYEMEEYIYHGDAYRRQRSGGGSGSRGTGLGGSGGGGGDYGQGFSSTRRVTSRSDSGWYSSRDDDLLSGSRSTAYGDGYSDSGYGDGYGTGSQTTHGRNGSSSRDWSSQSRLSTSRDGYGSYGGGARDSYRSGSRNSNYDQASVDSLFQQASDLASSSRSRASTGSLWDDSGSTLVDSEDPWADLSTSSRLPPRRLGPGTSSWGRRFGF